MISKGMFFLLQCYVVVLALFLSGCVSHKTSPERAQVKKPGVQTPAPSTGVFKTSVPELPVLNGVEDKPLPPPVTLDSRKKTPPKPTPPPQPVMHDYDWNKAVASVVAGVKLPDEHLPAGLLISQVGNKTNGMINRQRATAMFVELFSKRNEFHVLTEQGKVAGNDVLQSKAKALSVARNLGAQYLLYGWVSGNVDKAVLNVHLIEVNTGLLDYIGKKNLSTIKTARR